MSLQDRQKDILKIISQLDISPTMYKNAVEKYESISKYLENNGIEANMYPQGAFALGTVVRPNAKKVDASYDLDFICQIKSTRDDISANDLWTKVKDVLVGSDLYGGKLVIYEKCFTIEYADVNGVGFTIDIVPAVDESYTTKQRLRVIGENPELMETAIATAKYCDGQYGWSTNNPKGYRAWFEVINAPFIVASRDQYRQLLFEANRSIYASVEDIPEGLERSAVQRVIQILKYHRDIHYSTFGETDDTKPNTGIINTIVAQIASLFSPTTSVFDLLQYVLKEFAIYSEYQTIEEKTFLERYPGKNAIRRIGGKWKFKNPANPEDNLVDRWNEDNIIPTRFFAWAKAVREDLLDSLQMNDTDFRIRVENAFGQRAVEGAWSMKYNTIAPKPISPINPAKPWRGK